MFSDNYFSGSETRGGTIFGSSEIHLIMTSIIILCLFINQTISNTSYSLSESNGYFPDKDIYRQRASSLCKTFPKKILVLQ